MSFADANDPESAIIVNEIGIIESHKASGTAAVDGERIIRLELPNCKEYIVVENVKRPVVFTEKAYEVLKASELVDEDWMEGYAPSFIRERVKITRDPYPESPREWGNVGTIAYKHSRYTLGEEEIEDPIEWLEDMLGLERSYAYSNERRKQLEAIFEEKFIALPLFLYDHSGVSISTKPFSCRWDSGQVGYIYCTKERAVKEWGKKICTAKVREKALDCLRAEIGTYDLYLQGRVYGFEIVVEEVIPCEYGGEDDIEEIESKDSCGGFYGEDWMNNGMSCYIDKSMHYQLENIEVEE